MIRKMKDSGIEWIGEIPEEWKTLKIKNIIKIKGIKDHPDEQVLSLYRDLGIVIKNSRDDNYNRTSENTNNYKYVAQNDLVVNKMKAWQGSIAVSKYKGIVSPAYYVCTFTRNEIVPFYIHYLLRSSVYFPEYRRLSEGIRPGQWDLSFENFRNIAVIVPIWEEQNRMVKYLDQKCTKIDKTIEKQKQVIEKLKAYKQSVITEAVTKGLNSDIPMKDSGIEWIGEIPEHWKVVQLSRLFKERKFKNQNNIENNVLSLSYGNIKRRDIDTNMGLLPESFETYNIVEAGNIVLRLTDLQNDHKSLRCGLVKERGIITSAYVTLGKIMDINTNYYYRLLHTFDIMKGFYGMGDGVRQSLKYSGELNKLLLILPPTQEQDNIASYLDCKCSKIDATIAQKETLIQKLIEYKKSLIYECITGKREV
ncbi:EcoKI restriction-modification system protein HsdS [Oxobacter pfennigii]|uniref:EcoKI restriction-modification system protein HsdS n=1 Tax=Oxobacter pfennigii TaxID=36849 RepID=A0A0P8WKA4_9CLOT|nr:restriction endonuclease subunit S [Oxobacter pfennigii]KPU42705.1 EcoKI restriction-modification system protein HsdS [Oxobacter pfennigii]